MARKGITFLGTGKYEPIIYEYQGRQSSKARFFAVSLCELFQPDEVLVVLTVEARNKHWAELQPLLASYNVREVDIPTGKSEEDLWQIFDTIAAQIDPGDQLVFDITHSFRSQPLLALLVANYVGVAKNAGLEALVYGAYDAKDDNVNVAPVFDLTPFVRLLDWTSATDMFLKTGRAAELAQIVRNETARSFQAAGSAPGERRQQPDPQRDLKRLLDQTATQLEGLADALRLTRPVETQEEADKLLAKLGQLRTSLETVGGRYATQPFELLLDRIAAQFAPLALANPLDPANREESLRRQDAQLQWYLDRSQPVQAITLARELLVSRELFAADPAAELTNKDERKKVEDQLGYDGQLLRGQAPSEQLAPEQRSRAELWNSMARLRNDVAHVGMSRGAIKAKKILEQVQDVCAKLLQRTTAP